MLARPWLAAIPFLASPLPTFAGVVFVAPNPGQPDVVQQAIAQAAPGDVIVLQPGAYAHSAPIEIEKSLTLVGTGASYTNTLGVTGAPSGLALWIHNIDASEEVRVLGLELSVFEAATGGGGSLDGVGAVRIEDCAGPVTLAGVEARVDVALHGLPGHVDVRAADHVVLDRCAFVVAAAATEVAPTPAVRAEGSRVWLQACELTGASAGIGILGQVFDGAPAVELVASEAFVARCAIRGGDGSKAQPLFGAAPARDGAAGVRAAGGRLELGGGSGNLVLGGEGGTGWPAGSGAGGLGVEVGPGGQLLAASDAVMMGGLDGDGLGMSGAFGGSGSLAQSVARFASLELGAVDVALGGMLDFDISGEPGGVAVLAWSVGQVAGGAGLGATGALGLDLATLHVFATPALGPTGEVQVTRTVSANPSLVGLSLAVQGAVVQLGGGVDLTGPAAFVLL